jgi:hypothetical protein
MVTKGHISNVGLFDALMKSLREDNTGTLKKNLIFLRKWWQTQMIKFVDRELDQFIAQTIMGDPGVRPFTSAMAEAWRLVRLMIQKYYVELKLDMFLGVTGEHWVPSFYSPTRGARYEGRGLTAPLASRRAARETFFNLTD